MKFDQKTNELVAELRSHLQNVTPHIDAAESVAIMLWWTFIADHARTNGLDPAWLAREQLHFFIDEAVPHIQFVKGH